MKTNKKLLMLLPMLPMLMANAPAPRAYPKTYTDFEASIEYIDYLYDYSFHYKNTGVGYISSFFASSDECSNFGFYFGGYGFCPISSNGVLIPGQEWESVRTLEEKVNDESKIHYTAEAYFDFADDVSVSGDLSIHESNNGKNGYEVNAELSGGDRSHYNYGLILKLTYDGNDYYIEVDQFDNFEFDTSDDFEKSKLTNIEVVEVTRSVTYGYRGNNNNGMGKVFMSMLLMPLIIILGVIALIVIVVIVSVIVASSKKRKKQSALANPENDSSQSDN